MAEISGFDPGVIAENEARLAENPYPGRGIILGRDATGRAAMVYWVMGRSDNSRNRILETGEGYEVHTAPHDASKVEDPSLIIYSALRTVLAGGHKVFNVVSNGDQTDTVASFLERYHAANEDRKNRLPVFPHTADRYLRDALADRDYEPDAPNYTPRITGMIATDPAQILYERHSVAYSIIRRNPTTSLSERTTGSLPLYELPAGTGLCFHTYQADGNPLPVFEGGPYAVAMPFETASEIANQRWAALNHDNRVALVARTLAFDTGGPAQTAIRNQL